MSTGTLDPSTSVSASVPPLRAALHRLRDGSAGSTPVVVALSLTWLVFYLANDRFLTPGNLTNLVLQIAAVGMIATGVVFVLLLGEIDLSVGAVSGLAAAVMAVLNVKHGVGAVPAIVLGISAGVAIGVLQGAWTAKLGVPSFVVTLAGLLAWQGALLAVLGETGTINVTDPTIVKLANTFYGGAAAWAVAALVVVLYAAALLATRRRRGAAGLAVAPLRRDALRVIVLGAAGFGTAAVLSADRGLPLALLILLATMAVLHVVATKTAFGRAIYAVGGGAEAARRAGIPVARIRIAVFALASGLAAVGGILAASRLLAVNQASGSGDLLLNAIAAAVIGGTSLFGGRGSVWSALLGALVIGSISNGMDLLAVTSSVKFMVTGGVLLLAVTIDAISRRERRRTGSA